MHKVLLGPREHHAVHNFEELKKRHAAVIHKRAAKGARLEIHEADSPKKAWVDHGSWMIDCECGGGCYADPEFAGACCFSCGAVHTSIIFPEDWAAVQAVLVLRPQDNRCWYPEGNKWGTPTETVDELRADNVAHGLKAG